MYKCVIYCCDDDDDDRPPSLEICIIPFSKLKIVLINEDVVILRVELFFFWGGQGMTIFNESGSYKNIRALNGRKKGWGAFWWVFLKSSIGVR
jgi:hypothetical protein